MNGSKYEWLAPLTGIAFIVVLVVSFVIAGEPPSADDDVQEIVDHYVDNKDSIMVGAFLGAVAGTLLVFFFGYVRRILRAAEGEGGTLSLIAFSGAVIIALAAAIDATISFALAEAADDIDPTAVQGLQALWDNDFVPFAVGSQVLWLGAGLSIVRHGALPKWLGWVAIVFGRRLADAGRLLRLRRRRHLDRDRQHHAVDARPQRARCSGPHGSRRVTPAQVGRRARQRSGAAPHLAALLFPCPERCPSGLRSSLGKRVGGLIPASWVRIPPSPLRPVVGLRAVASVV